jgi:hypothetical protein
LRQKKLLISREEQYLSHKVSFSIINNLSLILLFQNKCCGTLNKKLQKNFFRGLKEKDKLGKRITVKQLNLILIELFIKLHFEAGIFFRS